MRDARAIGSRRSVRLLLHDRCPGGRRPASGDRLRLPEIIVTAQKRAEKLQDVPIAITVVTGEALERANITAATDIKRLATSLQYSENQSVRGTSLQVRGVGTQSFSNGLEQSVGTVVDGVVDGPQRHGQRRLAGRRPCRSPARAAGHAVRQERFGGPGLDRLEAPYRRTERRRPQFRSAPMTNCAPPRS